MIKKKWANQCCRQVKREWEIFGKDNHSQLVDSAGLEISTKASAGSQGLQISCMEVNGNCPAGMEENLVEYGQLHRNQN